jgi:hypothetical protein
MKSTAGSLELRSLRMASIRSSLACVMHFVSRSSLNLAVIVAYYTNQDAY